MLIATSLRSVPPIAIAKYWASGWYARKRRIANLGGRISGDNPDPLQFKAVVSYCLTDRISSISVNSQAKLPTSGESWDDAPEVSQSAACHVKM
jgi:hypothetical protein